MIKDGPPAPPPPSPCIPALAPLVNDGAGEVDVSVTGPCAQVAGLDMALYRAEGALPLANIARLGASRTYHDGNVDHGKAYRYAARTYSHGGAVGAMSQERTITVVDSTPPAAPIDVHATANGLQVTLTWDAYRDDDLHGFYAYVSTQAGGPYQKINGTLKVISQPWEVTLVVSAPRTYYFVVTTVDFAGNESARSGELSVVLGP
jgi:fibronectin type 3 domain-containing protein